MGTPGLRLRLLGGCDIASAAGPVHLESSKTTALLALLALSAGPQTRSRLMGLLWGELSEERAGGNLRRAVWDLRRKLAPPAGQEHPLRATRVDLELASGATVDLDTARFERSTHSLRPGARAGEATLSGSALVELEEGVELYRGDLLEGFTLADAPEFEEWLLTERERLRRLAERALARLVEVQRARGDLASALGHARRLLALDPWREEAHRLLMELLAAAGDAAAALAQFESCRRMLAEQLQSAPSAETSRLAERIRGTPTARPASRGEGAGSGTSSVPPLPPPHNLPIPGTPFVGREEERAAILVELSRPSCRWLSLVGPGGVGKTRLALQIGQALVAAREPAVAFPDGVRFVGPRETGARGALAVAIADALGLAGEVVGESASGLEPALRAALCGRRLLLILDGLEHSRAEVALVGELLAAAAEVKVLATTRERLQLPEECVFALSGLDLPREETAAGGAAVQLFLQTARRARFGWKAEEADLPRIAEICRRLEGLPLGIELAAGWVGSLGVEEIAREVARDPGGLDPPAGEADSVDREDPMGSAGSAASVEVGGSRRGLRAVFDASWRRLSEAERRVLAGLSVFVGGFTREAAEKVAGAALPALRALVDRSLLRYELAEPRGLSGRYSLHEVVRRFALERLACDADTLAAVRERHARFIAERFAALAVHLWDGEQQRTLAVLALELENARAAWEWGVARGEVAVLSGCLEALVALATVRGWPRGAFELASAALATVEAGRRSDQLASGPGEEARRELIGRLRVACGGLRNRMGETARARADLLAGRRALRGTGARLALGTALFHLGEADYLEGRYGRARRLLDGALRVAREVDSPKLRADALAGLGRAALELGRHSDAEAAFAGSLEAAEGSGNEHAGLAALNQLGYMAYFRGDLAAAGARFGRSLERARAGGDRPAASSAETGLAYVSEDLGDFADARRHYEASLKISRELADRRGEAYCLMLIGENARRQGRAGEARRFYESAGEIAREIGSQYVLGLLAGNLAYLAAAEGKRDEAERFISEAVGAYRGTGAVPIALPVLVASAELALGRGESERGLAWLGAVLHHPADRQDHRLEVDRVLDFARKALGEERIAKGLAAGRALSLESALLEIETGLVGGQPSELATGACRRGPSGSVRKRKRGAGHLGEMR